MRTAVLALSAILCAAPLAAHEMDHPELDSWYESLTVPGPNLRGALCCNRRDCKPVMSRIRADGRWEVYVDRKTFPDEPGYSPLVGGAPDAWVVVPEEAIIRDKPNPNGEAVACWYNHVVRCFVPGAEV